MKCRMQPCDRYPGNGGCAWTRGSEALNRFDRGRHGCEWGAKRHHQERRFHINAESAPGKGTRRFVRSLRPQSARSWVPFQAVLSDLSVLGSRYVPQAFFPPIPIALPQHKNDVLDERQWLEAYVIFFPTQEKLFWK